MQAAPTKTADIPDEQRVRLDYLTRQCTAFDSFDQLLYGTFPEYAPTLYVHADPLAMELADAYDVVRAAEGNSRRVYRAGQPFRR